MSNDSFRRDAAGEHQNMGACMIQSSERFDYAREGSAGDAVIAAAGGGMAASGPAEAYTRVGWISGANWLGCAIQRRRDGERRKTPMRARVATCLLALMALPGTASAQDYPLRPIRWVVPFPPGGPTDVVSRTVGVRLSAAWSQQVVIDNRAGAAGVIGTALVAKAAPDGYTLLYGTSGALTVIPALGNKLPFDPFADFAPISLLVVSPHLLLVSATVPVSSLVELVTLAKSKPGQLNYASTGQGSPNHLGIELLKSLTGTDMVHVPYKGTGPAVTDLMGGKVQVMINTMPSVLPLVKAGRLKALAIGSKQRSPAAPDVPTAAEAGVPGFESSTWNGMFAPARTPVGVVAKVNAEVIRTLADPAMAERLVSQGTEPRSSTPQELTQFMRSEFERWRGVIRSAGIKAE